MNDDMLFLKMAREDALKAELAALREDLASAKADKEAYAQNAIDLRKRMTAAEQRNAELEKLLNGYPRGVPGFAAWADKVTSALKPTESGASE